MTDVRVHPAVAAAIAESARRCAEQRSRVLAHIETAERLTQPPLNYAQASQWNGYVPPAYNAAGQVNTSLRREALMRLIRAAAVLDADDARLVKSAQGDCIQKEQDEVPF